MSGMPFRVRDLFFLIHQRFERPPRILGIGRGRKANLTELGHVSALGAVAAARRRRAFGVVEFFPVVAQPSQMRAAGVGCDSEMDERIGLPADLLRHLLKFDPIVAQRRLALDLRLQLLPGGEKALGRDTLGKIAGEERRVVVAQFLAEPAESPRQPSRHDAKRQQERDVAVAVTAMTMTGRTPRRAPTFRCHTASQSKVWNAVQSATRSKLRHSSSTAARSL